MKQGRDFLSLYYYLTGQSEIPKGFHGWAGLSLIAALAEKRIWFEKFRGSKIFPNIYTFLIGPASVGKGGAISHAMRILDAANLDPPINMFRGRITYAYLEDLLGKRVETEGGVVQPSGHLWLIMDELANDLGDSKLAESFIKMMTELFTGDYDLSGGTRTHGNRMIREPSVNWLVGTTKDWLFDVITRKEMFSGFTARVFFCFREYQDIRYAEPLSPPDYDEVLQHLVTRMRAIHLTEGPMRFTEEARRLKNNWYMTRPLPVDEESLAAWKRGDDLVIKLCMIFSLADGTDLIIRPQHFIKARATFDNAFKDLDVLLSLACGTKDTEEIQFVENVIKNKKLVNRTALGKMAYKRGILSTKLEVILKDIESRGVVKVSVTQRGGRLYEWVG